MRAIAVLLVLAFSASARADLPAFRRLYNQGRQAYEHGHYEEAIELFQRARQEHDSPVALYGIARCYRALRRHPQAIVALEQYVRVATAEDEPTPEQAQAELRELRELVGILVLDVRPEGAIVRVDEEEVGRAPIENAIPLGPGSHIVQVSAPNLRSEMQQVDIGPGETQRVEIELMASADMAQLAVSSRPDDVAVYMDGAVIGGTPFAERVPPGPHVFRFARGGYHTSEQHVTLAPGQHRRLHIELLEDTVWTSPIFWTITLAILAGGAIGGGYAAWYFSQPQLYGNLESPGPIVMALRLP